jgi:hypothetical protein
MRDLVALADEAQLRRFANACDRAADTLEAEDTWANEFGMPRRQWYPNENEIENIVIKAIELVTDGAENAGFRFTPWMR